VSSDLDDVVLSALDSNAFTSGLSLMTAAQPALRPLVGLATSVVQSTIKRKKNAQIHNFRLGLDFGSNSTSVGLRMGSYIVVQTDEHAWDWSACQWNSDNQTLHPKDENAAPLEVNYMVFGISEFFNE